MMTKIKEWFAANKKKVIIGGGIALALGAVIWFLKRKKKVNYGR